MTTIIALEGISRFKRVADFNRLSKDGFVPVNGHPQIDHEGLFLAGYCLMRWPPSFRIELLYSR